jgi:hypothetical protein
LFHPFDFGFEQVLCERSEFGASRRNYLTHRILCVPADYSTPFLTLAMKEPGPFAFGKRVSRRYNAVLKCRVFKAFYVQATDGRRRRGSRRRVGRAKVRFAPIFGRFLRRINLVRKDCPFPWSSSQKKRYR